MTLTRLVHVAALAGLIGASIPNARAEEQWAIQNNAGGMIILSSSKCVAPRENMHVAMTFTRDGTTQWGCWMTLNQQYVTVVWSDGASSTFLTTNFHHVQ